MDPDARGTHGGLVGQLQPLFSTVRFLAGPRRRMVPVLVRIRFPAGLPGGPVAVVRLPLSVVFRGGSPARGPLLPQAAVARLDRGDQLEDSPGARLLIRSARLRQAFQLGIRRGPHFGQSSRRQGDRFGEPVFRSFRSDWMTSGINASMFFFKASISARTSGPPSPLAALATELGGAPSSFASCWEPQGRGRLGTLKGENEKERDDRQGLDHLGHLHGSLPARSPILRSPGIRARGQNEILR